jgi:hypothetical protein
VRDLTGKCSQENVVGNKWQLKVHKSFKAFRFASCSKANRQSQVFKPGMFQTEEERSAIREEVRIMRYIEF